MRYWQLPSKHFRPIYDEAAKKWYATDSREADKDVLQRIRTNPISTGLHPVAKFMKNFLRVVVALPMAVPAMVLGLPALILSSDILFFLASLYAQDELAKY